MTPQKTAPLPLIKSHPRRSWHSGGAEPLDELGIVWAWFSAPRSGIAAPERTVGAFAHRRESRAGTRAGVPQRCCRAVCPRLPWRHWIGVLVRLLRRQLVRGASLVLPRIKSVVFPIRLLLLLVAHSTAPPVTGALSTEARRT